MGAGDAEVWFKDETNTPYGIERIGNKPLHGLNRFVDMFCGIGGFHG